MKKLVNTTKDRTSKSTVLTENEKLRIDLERNKKARRQLSLRNNIQESQLQSLTLLQDVVEKINTVDDLSKLFHEIGNMFNKVLPHDASVLFLHQTKMTYINSRFQISEEFSEKMIINLLDVFEEYSGLEIDYTPEIQLSNLSGVSYVDIPGHKELHEIIILPVLARDECMGTIGIFSTREQRISIEQCSHFKEIVKNTAMLLDNAVLYDRIFVANSELGKKISSLKRLLEISEGLSGKMSHEELIDFILSAAIQEINADGGSLMLVDHRKQELHLEAIKGLPETFKTGFKMRMGEGIAGLVAEEKEPWILLDLSLISDEIEKKYNKYTVKFFPFDKYQERAGVISAISIPLTSKQEVLGVLNLTSSTYIFTEEDLEMVMLFGSLAANAIRNTYMMANEERRIKELVKFSDIGKMLSSTFEHSEIIHMVVDSLSEMLNFNVALFLVEEPENFVLTVISSCNVTLRVVDKLKQSMMDKFEKYSGKKIHEDEIEISFKKIGNVQVEISNEKFESIINAPLSMKGETRGVLSLLAFEDDFFDEEAERTLITFSSTIAVALENSASYEKMQRTVKELSTLFEVSKSMTSTLDLDEALNMIVSISAELMDARIAFLRLLNDDDELIVKSSYGDFDQSLSKISIKPGSGVTGKSFSKREPLVITQIGETEILCNKEQLLSHGLNSCIAVPLVIKEKAIGVITCFFDEVKKFADSEVNLLSALASHASIAIENAKMYEEMNENYTNTIMALSAAIDAKDHYTHGHSKNVMEYAVAIARELKLNKEEIETIKFAGLLHDIGKIGIPETILRKSSGLSESEFKIICTHPKLGAAIMDQVQFLRKISPLAYHHHERYDGKGYPDGISGKDIPLGARILNLADSFDVMTTSRVYRNALKFEEAMDEVKRCKGKQFDPEVVEAFLEVIGKVYQEVKESDVNSIVELVRKSYDGELI